MDTSLIGFSTMPYRCTYAWTGTVVVAKSFEHALMVYTAPAYEEFLGQVVAMDQFKGKARDVKRWFTANANEVDIDKSGRVNLPAVLSQWAELTDEAVVIGMGDHLEVWSPAEWQAYQAGTQDIASLAEEISDLGVF